MRRHGSAARVLTEEAVTRAEAFVRVKGYSLREEGTLT